MVAGKGHPLGSGEGQDGAACTLKSEILIRLGRHSHLVPVVFGSVSPRDILVGAVPLILPTVRKPELPAGMVPSKLTFSRGQNAF